jgi:hypothetical protein
MCSVAYSLVFLGRAAKHSTGGLASCFRFPSPVLETNEICFLNFRRTISGLLNVPSFLSPCSFCKCRVSNDTTAKPLLYGLEKQSSFLIVKWTRLPKPLLRFGESPATVSSSGTIAKTLAETFRAGERGDGETVCIVEYRSSQDPYTALLYRGCNADHDRSGGVELTALLWARGVESQGILAEMCMFRVEFARLYL